MGQWEGPRSVQLVPPPQKSDHGLVLPHLELLF